MRLKFVYYHVSPVNSYRNSHLSFMYPRFGCNGFMKEEIIIRKPGITPGTLVLYLFAVLLMIAAPVVLAQEAAEEAATTDEQEATTQQPMQEEQIIILEEALEELVVTGSR